MIDFEKLWLDGVNDRFWTLSSDIILNDKPKNARHLLRKLFQVGLTERAKESDGRRFFRLATTRLCHVPERSSERDVYDYPPLVDDARRFIESGGYVRVVCRQRPLPSDFLTLLKSFADKGSDRVQIHVRSEARNGGATPPWRDFSICGNSYRFEVSDDEASQEEETPTAQAIACADDQRGVVPKLKALFERQWGGSEQFNQTMSDRHL